MHAYVLIRTFAKLDFEKYSIIPAYDFSMFGLYMGIIGVSKTQNIIYGITFLKSLKKLFILAISQMRTICTNMYVLLESVSCQELIVNSKSFSDFAKTCFFPFYLVDNIYLFIW